MCKSVDCHNMGALAVGIVLSGLTYLLLDDEREVLKAVSTPTLDPFGRMSSFVTNSGLPILTRRIVKRPQYEPTYLFRSFKRNRYQSYQHTQSSTTPNSLRQDCQRVSIVHCNDC